MDQSLQRYAGGTPHRKVPKHERPVVSQAAALRDEVRLAAFKADASIAFTSHVAEELCDLHDYLGELSKEDASKRLLVGELFGTCVGQVKKYQRQLFDPWGF
jgi:hypothetical protein